MASSDGGRRIPAGPVAQGPGTLASFGSMTPRLLTILKIAVAGLGDVHVHANMMLTGRHFSWTTRPPSDLGVVERLDHVVLL